MSLEHLTQREEEIYYGIALGLIPGIGHIYAKTLLSYSGSFKEIFKAKSASLARIPGIGVHLINKITTFRDYELIEKEMKYIEKNGISTLFYSDKNFPQRLLNFNDSPFLLFTKGNLDLNSGRTLGIVGTRAPSNYGVKWTQELIEQLKNENLTIVSGFAYGIDIAAHRAAIKHNVPTIGVIAGGFQCIYPAAHKRFMDEMCEIGGFITEAYSDVLPNRERFPMRNRIIAAQSDGVLVVESAEKGGSMITAEYAFSYNKPIMALPGKPNDLASKGCNAMIKKNKAAMVENAIDVMEEMNWDDKSIKGKNIHQASLFRTLSDKEQSLIDLLIPNREINIDELMFKLQIRNSEFAAMILALTMDGLITQLPGNRIALN